MKHSIGFILFIFFFCLAPIIGEANSNIVNIGTILERTSVYQSPTSNSKIIDSVDRGDEFPIISNEAGRTLQDAWHIVENGDTLLKLAKRYETTVESIQEVNQLDSIEIYNGQQLKIPRNYFYYTVERGNTLATISNKYTISIQDLKSLNKLEQEQLMIGQKLKIPNQFYKIQLLGGAQGWVKKAFVNDKKVKRLVMGWNHGHSTEENIKQMKDKQALDVVSPRWYSLENTSNVIKMNVDVKYVEAAHRLGKQVWPLIGNNFDPELTNEILSNKKKRKTLVSKLTNSLIETNSDGVNIDFENINIKNKHHFVLFVKELKSQLAPHEIIVSVDVTRTNDDPFWSKSFDRYELGKVADYVIMMGYDEHWGGADTAGSVASIPWVHEGIQLLMKDVPAHKIILGIPFYTREWITDLKTKEMISKDLTMNQVQQLIKQKQLQTRWDIPTSQNYVEYTENGKKHQIWIEDVHSLNQRLAIVRDNHLGGAIAWYLGGESEDIWDTYHFNEQK